MTFPIGVLLDSFRTGIREALASAAELGVEGIQVYATAGEMAPQNMTPAKRREFLDMVRSHGLTISALCGDLGGGFADPQKNPARIETSKRILDLARDLETRMVTTHIGIVPADVHHPRYSVLQEACQTLGEYADELESYFAIETGPETSAVLCAFLDSLSTKGVAVNLDPANLVMVTGDDPVQAVHTLKGKIVHTHAKDGRMLRRENPEVIYGLVSGDNSTRAYEELPLGEGSVPFPAYLAALKDIGFTGFLTIEREVGDNPTEDIRRAVSFLKGIFG